MDIAPAFWHIDLIKKLEEQKVIIGSVSDTGSLLELKSGNCDETGNIIFLNLLSLGIKYSPKALVKLKNDYSAKGITLIQLWEDIWESRPVQVINRLLSLLGLNQQRVHGRQTTVSPVTQTEADHFMDQYHLQGGVKSRYRLALMSKGEMVAVATFSARRRMSLIAETYYSVELIRFASVSGVVVQGGLSKLIRHLINLVKPDDVMTYADLDWSSGAAYEKLGFTLVHTQPASEIWVSRSSGKRYFEHRLPPDFVLDPAEYIPVFNTGNLKYILYLNGR
ncbi:hypothetical protein [Pedobacter antarcticus]|uniref:hypothetical protein n=1 Tax=Pedobacter antarcticus TaxID=34086 RepID=UPI00292D1C58|nr:hypothetical protein [Pedobacter antarcticus]